ncbi:virulence factor MVIN [delta proteobacterium NaphS2]|nr:virulence factor MVIN [delta proteobacterium NaphS2]
MKLAIQLSILASLNIGTGFLYQWYVFTQLGPGMETDALFAGMTVPQVVLAIVTGSLMHVLVPLLAGEDENRLRRDAWGVLALISGLFSLLAVILYLTAPWWVPLTVPGFEPAGKCLTVILTRVQLVGMVFSAVSSVQWAVYHARQHFLWAELTPVLASISGLLLLVWALPHFGVIAAAWIATIRMGLQALFLAPGMGKPVFPDLKNSAVREAWHRIRPLLLGSVYFKTEPLVDRFLLSWATSGSLSLFFLAQRLFGAVNQICNKAIVAPLVPKLSKYHKSGSKRQFRAMYLKNLWLMIILGLAGLVILGLVGDQLLAFLIGHGNITRENVRDLWWIMIWLGGALVGGMVGQVTSSTFYACGNTVTPTKLGICSYSLYVPSKAVSFFFWGIKGLAISTSVYYLVNLLFQIYFLEKEQPS